MTFHANYIQQRQFAWHVISFFLGKNKKNIPKCHLLRILPRVLSIRVLGTSAVDVCSFVLRFYPNVVMLSTVNLLSQTFTGQALSSKWLTSIVHILSLPFLNQQQGEKDCRKYFMINLHERMLLTWQGLNPQPPDHQSDTHPTEPPRQAQQ